MTRNDHTAPRSDHLEEETSNTVSFMVESIVGCKWSVRLLELCTEGLRRPSAFLRACPGLSAKVMNERWRKMVRFGIVERIVTGEKPPLEVEYLLTPFGDRFLAILNEVRRLQEELENGIIRRDGEAGAELVQLSPPRNVF